MKEIPISIYIVLELFLGVELDKLEKEKRLQFLDLISKLYRGFLFNIISVASWFLKISEGYLGNLIKYDWYASELSQEELEKLKLTNDPSLKAVTNGTLLVKDLAKKIKEDSTFQIKNKPDFVKKVIKFSQLNNIKKIPLIIEEDNKMWVFDGNKRLTGLYLRILNGNKFDPIKVLKGKRRNE